MVGSISRCRRLAVIAASCAAALVVAGSAQAAWTFTEHAVPTASSNP